MNKTEKKIAQAAERWEGKGYEESKEQRERIAQTAQAILDARALYPDSSLADLYDPITMPPELLKATATTTTPSYPPTTSPQQ
jgi:hypothetical protein